MPVGRLNQVGDDLSPFGMRLLLDYAFSESGLCTEFGGEPWVRSRLNDKVNAVVYETSRGF